jgi:hypothetical protein
MLKALSYFILIAFKFNNFANIIGKWLLIYIHFEKEFLEELEIK